jgi:hypothetical protein
MLLAARGGFPRESALSGSDSQLPHVELLNREETVCEEPLLTVDRQMGLNIVHPEGKVRVNPSNMRIIMSFHPLALKNHLQSYPVRPKHR